MPKLVDDPTMGIAVFLVMNLFTCVWNTVTNALITNAALRNTLQSIVTAVVTGGVAMVIIFAVDNKILRRISVIRSSSEKQVQFC